MAERIDTDGLNENVGKLNRTVREVESVAQEATSAFTEIQNALNATTKQLTETGMAIGSMRSPILKSIASLASQIETNRQNIVAQQQQIGTVTRTRQAQEARLKQLQEERAVAAKDKAEKDKAYSNLIEYRKSMESEIQRLGSLSDEQDKNINIKREEINQTQSRIALSQKEIAAKKEAIQSQIADVQSRVQEIKDRRKNKPANEPSAPGTRAAAKQEIIGLRQQEQSLMEELALLEKSAQENTVAQQSLAEQESRLAELQAEREKTFNELLNLQGRQTKSEDEARESLDELTAEREAATEQLKRLDSQIQTQQNAIRSSTEQEAQLENVLRSKVAALLGIPDDMFLEFVGGAEVAKKLVDLQNNVTVAAREHTITTAEVRRSRTAFSDYTRAQNELSAAFSQLGSSVISSIVTMITDNNIAKERIGLERQKLEELRAEQASLAAQQSLAQETLDAYQRRLDSLNEAESAAAAAAADILVQKQAEIEIIQDAIKKQQESILETEKNIAAMREYGVAQEIIAAVERGHADKTAELTALKQKQTEAIQQQEDAQQKATAAQMERAAAEGPLKEKIQEQTSEIEKAARRQKALNDEVRKQELELKNAPLKMVATKFAGMAKVIDAVVKSFDEMVGSVRKTQQSLGIASGQAANLKLTDFKESALSSLKAIGTNLIPGGEATTAVSAEQLQGARQSFQAEFGGVLTSDAARKLAEQAQEMGVTTDQLAVARRQFMTVTGGSLTQATAQQDKFIDAFKSKGLTAKDALDAISKNSEIFARNGTRFAASFARAAAEAKKIGVDLGKVDQIGDNIIGDFEGFLEKTAELGAMGFNFDTSRLAEIAESGDTGALMGELRSQLAAQGKDLNNLRRSEQLALSQAFGIPMAELLRLAKPETKGKEATSGEQTVDQLQQANGFLKTLVELMGALSSPLEAIGTVLKGIAALYLAQIARNTAASARAALGQPAGGQSILQRLFGGGSAPSPTTVGPGVSTPGTSLPTAPPAGATGTTPPASGVSFVEKLNPAKMIAGAAALLIVSAALFVAAKALQQFNTVDWPSLAKAGLALLGLVAAVAALGMIMTSGVGAVAIIAGAAALAIIAGSVLLLGNGIMKTAAGIEKFVPQLSSLKSALKDFPTDELEDWGDAAGKAAKGGKRLGEVKLKVPNVPPAPAAPTTATTTTPAPLPAPKIDTAALEKKLDNVVAAIAGMKIQMDGIAVGKIIADGSNRASMAASLNPR